MIATQIDGSRSGSPSRRLPQLDAQHLLDRAGRVAGRSLVHVVFVRVE
jgi:hypothetical protein